MHYRRFFFSVLATALLGPVLVSGQDDLRIWREFIVALKSGKITADHVRPHKELGDRFRTVLLGYLDSVRVNARDDDWNTTPEIVRIDNRVQFITPWTTGAQKVSYCFSFVTEGARWYFQHLEAVFIRLDKISRLPARDFPDVSEAQKNWAREEISWSFIILNFYLPLAKEKGSEYALSLLKDGAGYFVGAKTWVPFAPPQRAFILYLCWEQAKLRGNGVTLVKLGDDEAIVELESQYLALYSVTGHLKPRITLDEYKRIFETIWHDRAENAGWKLEIAYHEGHRATFRFTRAISGR